MSGLFSPQKTNDEFLSQFNGDVFEVASDGVYLAVALLTQTSVAFSAQRGYQKVLSSLALKFLHRYADWRKLDIPSQHKRAIAVMNYGEEEVQAMEQAGEEDW